MARSPLAALTLSVKLLTNGSVNKVTNTIIIDVVAFSAQVAELHFANFSFPTSSWGK